MMIDNSNNILAIYSFISRNHKLITFKAIIQINLLVELEDLARIS